MHHDHIAEARVRQRAQLDPGRLRPAVDDSRAGCEAGDTCSSGWTSVKALKHGRQISNSSLQLDAPLGTEKRGAAGEL